MIWKWVQDLVGKYSFIEEVTMKGGVVRFYYLKNDKLKVKKLPLRCDKPQVIRMIENIKKDIGFAEKKKLRDEQVNKEVKKEMNQEGIIAI
jgi:hypothetical protein